MSSARARLRDVPPEGPLTISDAVARIIMRDYLLHESLRMKIVNFHALAKKILADAPAPEDAIRRAYLGY